MATYPCCEHCEHGPEEPADEHEEPCWHQEDIDFRAARARPPPGAGPTRTENDA